MPPEASLAAMASRCFWLPVAAGRGLDVNWKSLTAGEHMRRNRGPLAALTLIAIVALISGCGSSAPAETDSASGGAGNGASIHSANAQKAVKFAECMRSNGVGQFP